MEKNNIKRNKIIIYECDHSGHRVGYLTYIINYVIQNVYYLENALFVLGAGLIDKLSNEGVDLTLINLKKLDEIYEGDSKRDVLLLKDLNIVLKNNPTVDTLVLMNFDLFIYAFLRTGIKNKIKIRAIFFRPYIHFPVKTLKDKAQYLIKKILLKFLLFKNVNIEKLFILNDEDGVDKLNHSFCKTGSKRFYYLPDPVKVTDNIFYKDNNLIDNKISFLIIGTIDEKKNVKNFLNALSKVQKTTNMEFKVTIAGNVKNHFKKELNELIDIYKVSGIEIDLIDKFLSEEEFDSLLSGTNVVFMAYTGFYSSSGILGYSILNLKPFVYSDNGLVKQIVGKYKTGFGCNPNDNESIKFAILEVINKISDSEYFKNFSLIRSKYIYNHRSELFVSIILNQN